MSRSIAKKVEVETKDKDGKTGKAYRVLVARDGWKIERQRMDPPILRATGPATLAGESADRKLVKEFSSDVLRRSRFS